VRPILAAIHMVIENDRVAFIDTGSNDALPNALAALKKLGLGVVGRDHGFAAVFLLPEKALIIGAISLMRAVHCSIACLCIASSSVSLAR